MYVERFRQERIPQFIEILRNKIVSFDVDGVIADTKDLVVRTYNERFNDDKRPSDITDFFSVSKWIEEKGKSEQEALGLSMSIWNDMTVLSESKPLEGAWLLCRYLLDEQVDIRFITSRPSFTRDWTFSWFEEWFPWVDKQKIHMGENNDLQMNFKKVKVLELSSFHFEDAWQHAEDIAQSGDVYVVLVRQPWNSGYSTDNPKIIVPGEIPDTPELFVSYAALASAYRG